MAQNSIQMPEEKVHLHTSSAENVSCPVHPSGFFYKPKRGILKRWYEKEKTTEKIGGYGARDGT